MKWPFSIPYRFRPSLGFLLVVVAYVGVTLFFWWGTREPDLDVVWRIEMALENQESVPLAPDERAALGRALEAHPELDLVITDDGHAAEAP